MGTWESFDFENLGMMSHSIESFEGEYDPWMKMWLWQKLMVGFGCDTIPILLYPHNTWQWVGLNWKFMYFSMGSLWTSVIGVMPRLPPWKVKWRENEVNDLPKPCAVPRMAVCHHLEAKLMGEVPILGYVIERLWLIIRILNMIIQGYPWRMYQKLWHKCTTSAECKTIRIAAPAVMGSWKGHTVPLSDVFKMTCDLKGDFDLITTELWEWHLCSHLSHFRQIESLLLLSVNAIKLALCK